MTTYDKRTEKQTNIIIVNSPGDSENQVTPKTNEEYTSVYKTIENALLTADLSERDRSIFLDTIVLLKGFFTACFFCSANFGSSEEAFANFINAKHDRVKTNDWERLLTIFKDVAKKHSDNLHTLCEHYISQIAESTESERIKKDRCTAIERATDFLEKPLTDLNSQRGIAAARGYESNPPVTMYIIESILAHTDGIRNFTEGTGFYKKYISEFQAHGIVSDSFDRIFINSKSTDGLLKIRMINKYKLYTLKANNTEDLILTRHILAQQKVAEYHFWEDLLNSYKVSENVINTTIEAIMSSGW